MGMQMRDERNETNDATQSRGKVENEGERDGERWREEENECGGDSGKTPATGSSWIPKIVFEANWAMVSPDGLGLLFLCFTAFSPELISPVSSKVLSN